MKLQITGITVGQIFNFQVSTVLLVCHIMFVSKRDTMNPNVFTAVLVSITKLITFPRYLISLKE